jgi:hypothetical protein
MEPESEPAEVYPPDVVGWKCKFNDGFEVPVLRYDHSVTGLPARQDGTFLIVTKEVAETCLANGQPVDDLLVPDAIIHQDDGAIVFKQFRSLYAPAIYV